jgi:hypothetical protein
MLCDWCNQPIRGRKEKVGNASLHPDCLDEVTELTEPMFQEKLHGITRSEQNSKARPRVNRDT